MTAGLPVLYSFRRCPYAMRARLALAVAGQHCALREVVLRDKPSELLAISPKGTVPVLELSDGCVLDESYDIMKWALARNDPEHWLSPQQGTFDEMDTIVADNDGAFKHHLDRYKYPTRYDGADSLQHRQAAFEILKGYEARLAKRPYLFGDHLSLADAAVLPFVRQFAMTDQAWFDGLAIPGVQAWLQAFLDSARFQSVMKKYAPWQAGSPESVFP